MCYLLNAKGVFLVEEVKKAIDGNSRDKPNNRKSRDFMALLYPKILEIPKQY